MGVRIDHTKKIVVEDLDTIYITGGGFVNKAFKGIGRNSAWAWDEVVWNANLSRSSSFIMTNIDNVGIGIVTNIEIIFPLMNMQDFINLQSLLHERHIIVNYFCVDDGKRHTKEMAITGNERKKLYNFGKDLLGMQEVKVKMVSTNRMINIEDTEYKIGVDLPIVYNDNVNGNTHTDNVEYTKQYVIKNDENLGFTNGKKHLKEWNTKSDGTGQSYLPNLSITIWKSLELYAIWE